MNATQDARCPKKGCGHSKTGYHVGPDWCAICIRQGGPCTSTSSQRSAEGAPITEGDPSG